MKTLYGIAATLVALSLALPGVAVAGRKWGGEVNINNGAAFAQGTMGSARNSRDSTQQIGCFIQGNVRYTPYTLGSCSAYDANGDAASCVFVDRPVLQQAVASISDDSFLVFGWDNGGQCTFITVVNDSAYEPRGR
jgi:hypothetical protein